jgi:hypothetical protein
MTRTDSDECAVELSDVVATPPGALARCAAGAAGTLLDSDEVITPCGAAAADCSGSSRNASPPPTPPPAEYPDALDGL